jgi:hypothetical protein
MTRPITAVTFVAAASLYVPGAIDDASVATMMFALAVSPHACRQHRRHCPHQQRQHQKASLTHIRRRKMNSNVLRAAQFTKNLIVCRFLAALQQKFAKIAFQFA